ncbi:heme oxygenase-like protein [Lentinus tigrinus ALCF2SS1-7]|uniref:heme oxygenase-like protein n=1 Tax=Lentinus tigrinus ALCF2SS1-7 TaxID=1328758 RepID=UPI0011661C60|nr:heme oxygenase-like protein [Lentinus tigrinus ALCF2SS1-7]
MSVPLTTHLVSLSTPRPYAAATEHPFLTAAGTGTLPLPLLSLYLSQDRLYAAHGYPPFIGQLLTRIPYSSTHAVDSPEEKLHSDVVKVLAFALQNVHREVGMFAEVERKYGLNFAQWRERKATRDYTAEMARVGALGTLEDGLIFLWAMERVYLDAWKYAKSLLGNVPNHEGDPTLLAIRQLVENWTCPEFEQFVDDIADLVNRLQILPGTAPFIRAEEIWARVVELEEMFWPVGGEELSKLAA